MTAPINIRLVRPDEMTVLRDFSISTFIETFTEHNTPENMEDYIEKSFDKDRLQSELISPLTQYYFAERGPDILGYLKLNFGEKQTNQSLENSCEIERIYVDPKYQGLKVGKSLFEKGLNCGRYTGLNWLWLGVWEQNRDAIEFYKKMGFETFGTHDFRLGTEAQTDLLMRVQIPPD